MSAAEAPGVIRSSVSSITHGKMKMRWLNDSCLPNAWKDEEILFANSIPSIFIDFHWSWLAEIDYRNTAYTGKKIKKAVAMIATAFYLKRLQFRHLACGGDAGRGKLNFWNCIWLILFNKFFWFFLQCTSRPQSDVPVLWASLETTQLSGNSVPLFMISTYRW